MLVKTRAGRRRALRAGAAGSAAFAALGVLADPAAAHYVYQKTTVYGSSTNCTGGRAETSHGSGGGYSKADVYSWVRFSTVIAGDADCFSDWPRPAGYLAVAYDFFKWDGSQWALCRYTDWYYNQSTTHQYAIYTDHGSKAPCGSGTYNTKAYAYVYNMQWYGGWVWSGNHDL